MPARILFLTHEPPLPLVSGARIRSYHLMRELARHGHAVSLVALDAEASNNGEGRKALDTLCEHVAIIPFRPSRGVRRARLAADFALARPFQQRYFFSREGLRAVERVAAASRPDIVVVGQLYTERYARAAAGVPVIFDSHNVEERRVATMEQAGGLRGTMARRQRGPVRRYEAEVVRAATRVWAVSEEERQHFDAIAPGNVDLIANGVDCSAIPFRPSTPKGAEILFLGRMDYGPNIDGVQYLLEDVVGQIRAPGAHVRIVGANPPPTLERLAQSAPLPVEVTGFVVETAPYLASARLLVVSLRSGGGTRLKILEALAGGVPIVTTTLGCEGLGVTHEHDVLIADDGPSLAAAIDRLIADDELCERLARNGRALVEQRFDWHAIGALASESLETALGSVSPDPAGSY